MHDPHEGLAPDGTVTTGARRDRVPAAFEPVLADAVAGLAGASVYLYGSVATGQAVPGRSDVDLLAIGADAGAAARLAATLTDRYRDLARVVAVVVDSPDEYGEGDEAHGNKAFLRHYCVWLSGPDPAARLPRHRGDAALARGFNGDLPRRLAQWRDQFEALPDDADAVAALSRRVARKTLFGVTGLVSVHDGTWTTDRHGASVRWGDLNPDLAVDLARLLAWSEGGAADRAALGQALEPGRDGDPAAGVVAWVCAQFVDRIGAWR